MHDGGFCLIEKERNNGRWGREWVTLPGRGKRERPEEN